jgi:hypothetical protein
MDISTFFETIKTNPACFLIAGIVLGYVLRGFVLHGIVSDFRSKRSWRIRMSLLSNGLTRLSRLSHHNA